VLSKLSADSFAVGQRQKTSTNFSSDTGCIISSVRLLKTLSLVILHLIGIVTSPPKWAQSAIDQESVKTVRAEFRRVHFRSHFDQPWRLYTRSYRALVRLIRFLWS
jgi:hypothetical protein